MFPLVVRDQWRKAVDDLQPARRTCLRGVNPCSYSEISRTPSVRCQNHRLYAGVDQKVSTLLSIAPQTGAALN